MLHWTIWGRESGVHEAILRRYDSKLVYHITVYFLFTLVTVTCKYSTVTQLTYHFASYNSYSNWQAPTSMQTWRRRTRFCRTHSPSFPSLHIRHSSFSNPSVALPTSQLILQHFRCFSYVTVHSPTLLSLLLRHRLFTYVTWRAAHAFNCFKWGRMRK